MLERAVYSKTFTLLNCGIWEEIELVSTLTFLCPEATVSKEAFKV